MKKTIKSASNYFVFILTLLIFIPQLFSQEIFEDQNGKYGLRAEDGKILIEPKYDWIGKLKKDLPLNKNYQTYQLNPNYTKNFVRIKMGDNYGVFNYAGEEIFPIKADFIHEEYSSDSLLWIRAKDKTYSFLNLVSKKVIQTNYEFVSTFSEGKAAVFKNFFFGYIDSSGKEIVPCNLEYAGGFAEDRALFKKGNKYGYIDPSGKVIIPAIYDKVEHFEFGLARVNLGGAENEIGFAGGKWGAIDKQGKVVVPLKYDGIEITNSIGLIKVNIGAKWNENCPCTKGGTWSVFDVQKQKIIYDEIGSFNDNMAFVKKDAKYGYINEKGELKIPFQFDRAESFYNKVAKVTINDSTFLINKLGVKLKKYEKEWTKTNGMILVVLGGKYGFLDSLRNEITKFEFDYAKEFSCDVAVVSSGGKWSKENAYSSSYTGGKYGVIDKKGNVVIPLEFQHIEMARENKMCFTKGPLQGFLNTKGEIIIEPIYNETRSFYDGLAAVKKNGKWGFINEKGEIVIELKYDEIETWPNKGVRTAYIGKEVFKFDLNGKPILD